MINNTLVNIYWKGNFFFIPRISTVKVYNNHNNDIDNAIEFPGVLESIQIRLFMFSDTIVHSILSKGKQWREQYLKLFDTYIKTISKCL